MESPLELRLAIAAFIGTSAMVLYLVALMAAARMYGRVRKRQRANFVDNWQAYLASNKPPISARVLSLHPDEVHHLLRVWNLAYEDIRARWPAGVASSIANERLERLRDIAYESGMSHAALAMAFRGRTREERISGIQALGGLGRDEVVTRLTVLVDHDDPLIALAAFEATLRIDPAVLRDRVDAILCQRDGWPEHAITRCVLEMDEATRSVLIARAVTHDARCANRIIAALEAMHHAGATAVIQQRLNTPGIDKAGMLYAVQDEGHIRLIESDLSGAGGP